MSKLIGFVATLAFALVVLYVYDTFVAKQEFDITKSIIMIVVVIVALLVGGMFSRKVGISPSPSVTI